MELIVDNQVIDLLMHDTAKISKHPGLSDSDRHLQFRWPSLLAFLGWEDLYSKLPAFDSTQPLFTASVATLSANEDKEVVFYVYDRLFTEILTQIKALPEINAAAMLEKMKERRQQTASPEVKHLFSYTLSAYETALTENPSHIMHDLILYLSWDRICVWMGYLFSHQSSDPHFIQALGILKECLTESYQHIAHEKRTAPGIYRMMESLIFYQMREENLQKHTDGEWATLSQSFPVLKGQNELADFYYIDDAVISERDLKQEGEGATSYATLDSVERVSARLALAQYMMKLLKKEIAGWDLILQPQNIIYLG